MKKPFAYDVFLSHSSKDKPAVQELAQRLQADGLRVWLDEWEIKPGDLIGLQIEKGLEQSRTLILIMSQNAFASEWVTLERHTVLFRDPTNKDRRFIPLLLDQTDIPDILKQFAYVDWREPTDQQYARLLASCRPSQGERKTEEIACASKSSLVKIIMGHTEAIVRVAMTAHGLWAVSASADNTIRIWDMEDKQCIAIFRGHNDQVRAVAISPDGLRAISGSDDKTVRIWDIQTGKCLIVLEGHTDTVWSVAISSDGLRAISSSYDKTARVWDIQTGICLVVLEGHIAPIYSIAIAANSLRAISGSQDQTVRIWDIQTGKCLVVLDGHTDAVRRVAISSDGLRAISSSDDKTARVWELPFQDENPPQKAETLLYTNAKVLLVGDSGVGKSGLAIRLTEDRFEATVSTDAAWATQLQLPNDATGDGIEREIWLWDFAGQADYRLTHQLYMDETALAAFVFNPQSENPFEGLGQWDRDLQRASRRPFRKLLVAGRCDVGGLTVSREAVEQFRKERGFDAYLQTSALSGEGCTELREAIIGNIAWESIPWTSSPRIFKVLKEEIVKLKDEGKALLRMGELKQQLEMRLPSEVFTLEELRAVVGLLAGPGVVWQLEFGDFVLLQPERINAYAAAAIRKVRSHTDELGYLREEDILNGNLDFQDMRRLPTDEEQIVLRAMHQTFVEHGLCLREKVEKDVLLVFPSYFKRERPEKPDYPAVCVTYRFNGALDEIYATLVVRLHHTTAFEKDLLWRFAADFKTLAGKRVGLKMTKLGEGAAELAVYFEAGVSDETQALFLGYAHDHLKTKGQDVVRERHYVCPHCKRPITDREAVRELLAEGKKEMLCVRCGKTFLLWDLIEEKFASEEMQQKVRDMEQLALSRIDNESRELILVGHAFAIAGEAGQIFRPIANSDHGIDGEIEFKNDQGEASGIRVYLQLKFGDSYTHTFKLSGKQTFTIPKPRHAEYWQSQAYPVMVVIRTWGGQIYWMDVSTYLKQHGTNIQQIDIEGGPFTASSVVRLGQRLMREFAPTPDPIPHSGRGGAV